VAASAQAQTIVERELVGGQSHSFEIEAQAGQFVRALLVERGAELTSTIFSPDGELLLDAHGRERISLIAPITGSYIVTVRPSAPDAPRARYELRLDAVRFPVAEDCLRLDAENAVLEGDRLEENDSAACVKQAGLQYRRAVDLADLLGDHALK